MFDIKGEYKLILFPLVDVTDDPFVEVVPDGQDIDIIHTIPIQSI